MEDYAGNSYHEDTANFVESEIYTYKVGVSPIEEDTIDFDYVFEKRLLFKMMDYFESNGISLLHFLYKMDLMVLDMPTLLEKIMNTLYMYDIDPSYAVGIMMQDFIKAGTIFADSGVGMGVLIGLIGNEFGFGFEDVMNYAIRRLFLPVDGDLNDLAAEALTASNYGELEDYFENDLGITNDNIDDYLFPDPITFGDYPEYRSLWSIKFDFGPFAVNPKKGGIVEDWEIDFEKSPFANWLDLLGTADVSNGQYGAAGLLLLDYGGVDNVHDTMMYLLNAETCSIPPPYAESNFTPYMASTVTTVASFVVGSVLYLGVKKQLIKRDVIFKKVNKELGLKKKKGLIKEKSLPLKELKN